MPFKVMFAIAILVVLLGVMLYFAPISVLVLAFGFVTMWAVHTVLVYIGERDNKP